MYFNKQENVIHYINFINIDNDVDFVFLLVDRYLYHVKIFSALGITKRRKQVDYLVLEEVARVHLVVNCLADLEIYSDGKHGVGDVKVRIHFKMV